MVDSDRGERLKWNRKYRERGPEHFGSKPAEWLVMHRDLLTTEPHRRALDVACGNGRNAAFLARLGFTVDALDVSDVVIAWLRERVAREGLSIRPSCRDLTCEPLPRRRYQVVLNFNYLQRDLIAALKDATAPGGLVVFDSFTRLQVALPRGPGNPEHTLETGELRRAFADFEILDYREITLSPKDGPARAKASLVARRPGRSAAAGRMRKASQTMVP